MFSMQQNRNVFISPTASICDWFWHSNINYLLWSSCLFILHFSRSLCLSCRHICIFFLSLSLCQPLLCSAQLISLDVPLLNVFIRILFSLFTATEAINCSADPVNSPCHDVLLSLVFFFFGSQKLLQFKEGGLRSCLLCVCIKVFRNICQRFEVSFPLNVTLSTCARMPRCYGLMVR